MRRIYKKMMMMRTMIMMITKMMTKKIMMTAPARCWRRLGLEQRRSCTRSARPANILLCE